MRLLPAILLAAVLAGQAVAQSTDTDEVFYPRTSVAAVDEGIDTPLNAGEAASSFVMFAGYGVVLAVLGLGVFFFLKRGAWRRVIKRSEGKLQVRESRMLGNRQFLMVVEYEDSRLLVGVSPGRIELLTPLGLSEPHLEAMPDSLMVAAKGG